MGEEEIPGTMFTHDEKVWIRNIIVFSIVVSVILSSAVNFWMVMSVDSVSEALRGPQGPQGIGGIQGIEGIQGIPGEMGLQGLIGPQGEIGEEGLQGSQGPPGVDGKSFVFDGEWVKTHNWYWDDDYLDYWTYTFDTESDITMINMQFISVGDYPEYAFMWLDIYMGEDPLEDTLLMSWWESQDSGSDTMIILGQGTYTLESATNYHCDIWIEIWQYLPTSSDQQVV